MPALILSMVSTRILQLGTARGSRPSRSWPASCALGMSSRLTPTVDTSWPIPPACAPARCSVVACIDVGPCGLEILVLAVKQIKQRALTNIELLTVRLARLFCRQTVQIHVFLLIAQAAHITEGNGQVLTHIAAGFFLQVACLCRLVTA